MLCKQVTISIPENEEIPEILTSFNSKENFIMIKIGCECIKQARTFLTNLSQSLISFPLIRGLESPEAGVFKPPPRSIFRSPQVVAKSPLFFLVLLVFVTGT